MSEPRQRVLEAIAKVCERDPATLRPDLDLVGDLGIDSADGLLLLIEIEELLGVEISDDDAESMTTVADILTFVNDQL